MFPSVKAVVVLALASTSLAAKCVRDYTVVAGDICDSISAKNKVSTFQLAAINSPAINGGCSNLEIGSKICLGTDGEDCQTTYVVKPDDTCDSIASGAKTNSSMIMLNNPQIASDCSNIYVGEVLCIAPTVLCPAVPATFTNPSPKGATPATPPPASVAPVVPQPSTTAAADDDADLPYCDEVDDGTSYN
jgi:LysM repeat protein